MKRGSIQARAEIRLQMAEDDNVIEFSKAGDDEWTPVEDDGCRWILDLRGGPFVVLPCDLDGSPVQIFSTHGLKHHKVQCPKCGKHTPDVIGGQLVDILELWNEMVSKDEPAKPYRR
jgi:hypothetical protein